VNNDDSSENQNRQGASLSTIKEFQIIKNNFTAEFGRGYGAVVLVQTKSGTNSIHGDVYFYHNDSALNATNNQFTPGARKPVNRRNQYGFTSGFPLLKNKLFGFVSLDHIQNSGAGGYTRDVFLPSERNPANWFLTTNTPATNTASNRAFIQSVIDRFPANLVPNDPRSPRTFVGQVGFDRPLKDYSGRLDWNPRSSDNMLARWQYTRQVFDNEDIIIGEATKQNNKQQNFGYTWTHIFSPSTVGEFRYGLGLRTTLVGIKAGNNTPIIRFGGSPVSGSIIGNAGAFPINRWQTDHQFVYNLNSIVSKHYFKAGTDIRRQQLDDIADNFSRGFYNMSATCNGVPYGTSYNAFLNGCDSNFQKGYGPFFLENRIRESNFYVEDNWKVRPNLTFNLGARYEYVSVPKEAADRINYGFSDDKDNIEPRFGFAWSPSFGDGFLGRLFGDGDDSVIRGGYGMFHGRIFQSVFSQSGATVRFNPPNALFYNESVASARFNPNNLTDPTNGFVFVPGPQAQRHPEAHIDPGLEMPYTQQWNFTIERELPFRSKVSVSYTGTRGIGFIKYTQENLPVAGDVLVANHANNAPGVLYTLTGLPANDPRRVDVRGQTLHVAADPQCAGTLTVQGIAATTLCPVAVPIGNLEYSLRLPRTNERRPDGRFSTNTFVSNNAWSYYNGLQVDWQKKLSRGLSFQAGYTWGKAIDTTSEATNLGVSASSGGDTNITGNSARASRGLSHFDTRHRFTFFSTYNLPFWRNSKGVFDEKGLRPGAIFGGWTVATVVKLSKGTPFTIFNSGGFGDLNFDGFTELRPALADPSVLGRQISNLSERLPASAFRTPTVKDFGCCLLGRNTFIGDGVKNVDLGIYRTFRMPWEGHRLLFRADLFNAFNHVQYAFPNTDLAAATFGRIISTANQYSPRVLQFSLRYQY
jgi:hypothetical protein